MRSGRPPVMRCGEWRSMAIARPSASTMPASMPWRRPSPGRAIGSRSHWCPSTPTSIDSEQAVLRSWWQDRAFGTPIHAYRLTAAGSRLPPRVRPATDKTSGLPRLTDRTRGNSPMVLESVRARPHGRPTGGGLPLTRWEKTPRTPIRTCGSLMRTVEPRVGSRRKQAIRSSRRGRTMGDGSTTPGGRRRHAISGEYPPMAARLSG